MKRFIKWLKELPYSRCKYCNEKAVRFIGEDFSGAGFINIYECKNCKIIFV